MRIIAGTNKGRKLIAPKNEARPTLDRSKESLFNILQFSIQNKDVLDVFAGSGALGLEAMSRGAKSATFIDTDAASIAAIRQNATACKIEPNIIKSDFSQALQRLSGSKFGLVFIDPPYDTDFCITSVQMLDSYRLLTDDAIVVCEHSRDKDLPDTISSLTKYRTRAVGIATFSFYKIGE